MQQIHYLLDGGEADSSRVGTENQIGRRTTGSASESGVHCARGFIGPGVLARGEGLAGSCLIKLRWSAQPSLPAATVRRRDSVIHSKKSERKSKKSSGDVHVIARRDGPRSRRLRSGVRATTSDRWPLEPAGDGLRTPASALATPPHTHRLCTLLTSNKRPADPDAQLQLLQPTLIAIGAIAAQYP